MSMPSESPDVRQAVLAIEAMVQKLRGRRSGKPGCPVAHEQDAAPGPSMPIGWWVVLCGRALDPEDYAQRELARRELFEQAKALGLADNHCIWVWDETDTAQIVVHHARRQDDAAQECARLAGQGLRVRVIREFS